MAGDRGRLSPADHEPQLQHGLLHPLAALQALPEQPLALQPPLLPQPEDVLADATLGSARAVRQTSTIGSLEVGKKADILVVDTQRSHIVPAVRIVSAWIHNGQPSDIESVMIDGRFVMRDRKILTVDEPRIIADANRVGQRVWSEVQKAGPIKVPRLPRPR